MRILKNFIKKTTVLTLSAALIVGSLTGCGNDKNGSAKDSNKITITNVSYDPTRELYVEYNKAFTKLNNIEGMGFKNYVSDINSNGEKTFEEESILEQFKTYYFANIEKYNYL